MSHFDDVDCLPKSIPDSM